MRTKCLQYIKNQFSYKNIFSGFFSDCILANINKRGNTFIKLFLFCQKMYKHYTFCFFRYSKTVNCLRYRLRGFKQKSFYNFCVK